MHSIVKNLPGKALMLWRAEGISYERQCRWLIPIFLAGFLIALFAPTTVLSDNPILQTYVSTMARGMSMCGGRTAKSTFPEVTALYHATICWGMPFVFLVTWKYLHNQINILDTPLFRESRTILNRIKLIGIIMFSMGLMMCVIYIGHGGDLKRIPVGTSRLYLATAGAFTQSAGLMAILAAFLFSIKRLFTFNFESSNHEQ
jgi:hypothetical protein